MFIIQIMLFSFQIQLHLVLFLNPVVSQNFYSKVSAQGICITDKSSVPVNVSGSKINNFSDPSIAALGIIHNDVTKSVLC